MKNCPDLCSPMILRKFETHFIAKTYSVSGTKNEFRFPKWGTLKTSYSSLNILHFSSDVAIPTIVM